MEGRLGKAPTPFDLAKFQALADGGQVSVRNLSVLYRFLRIDSEFYKPKYIMLESTFEDKENIYPLKKYCNYIKKGIFDISPDLYLSEGTPLIRTSEIKNPFINFLTTAFIDRETHQEHYKTNLKPDDIVMTKIGAYIGDVAILPSKYDSYNFSQNVTGLSINTNLIISKYLFAFLLSKFGRLQIKRIIMLSGQGKIELEDIRDISIYEAPKDFQHHISKLIDLGQSALSKSESVYKEAQEFLLTELGLGDWQPKHELTYSKNYSDTVEAGRIDAEYYQPKYEKIIKAITEYSIINYSTPPPTLGDLVTIKKSIEVGSSEYLNEGIPFIRVSNINPFEITEEKYISEELYNQIITHQPKKGEILLSKDATPGIAFHLDKTPKKMIPSGGILRLKLKTDNINGEYLTLVLNSLLTKEQANRDVGGSVIMHWRPEQVSRVVIPILPEHKQLEIQEKVIESFELRERSKTLLENAKRAVEIAIEQDETTAIQFLNSAT